jgi:hypothetical protein
MINRICISTTEGHSRGKKNRMKIVWSCVMLWLFVRWNEKDEMQEMRECLPQTSSGWENDFIWAEYWFHTILSIFSLSVFLIRNSLFFSTCKTVEALYTEAKYCTWRH